jgi:hypothetical protein
MYQYKYICFKLEGDTGKTKVFACLNTEHASLLGLVRWYGPWRRYSFFPEANIVFETQCLKDIASFLDKLMLERKLEKQKQQCSQQ